MRNSPGCGNLRRAIQVAAVALFISGASAQDALHSLGSIKEVIRRCNDYWIAHNAIGNNLWRPSTYHDGNFQAYLVLGETNYLQRSVNWGNNNGWATAIRSPENPNDYACGQTYFDLYLLDPQPVRIAAAQAAVDNRVANPAAAVDDWSWIDAFFMGAPVFARFSKLYSTNSYNDTMWLMYDDMKTRRGLWNAAEGLWYEDELAKTTVTSNGFKQFWGRGNGWGMAGMVRVAEQMSTNYSRRSEFISILQAMAAGLKPFQQSDGMWRSSIQDLAEVPNPETSCTAFFTFAIAWGLRNGCLNPDDYQQVVARAWNGMITTALHADGFLGYVQAGGRAPVATTYDTTYDFGVGAFLLAGAEVYRLAAMNRLVDDTWSDGTRTDTSLPDESAWFASTGASLDSATNSLIASNTTAPSLWLTYFTTNATNPATINLGQTLKATLIFTPTNVATSPTTPMGLRIGLFNYADAGFRVGADTFSATGVGTNVTGYLLQLNFARTFSQDTAAEILKRTNLAGSDLMGSVADYTTLGSGSFGYLGLPGFTNGQPYTLELSVTRADVGVADITVALFGGGLAITNRVTDTNNPNFEFDAFAIWAADAASTADYFKYSELKVELLPPPSTPVTSFPITSIETVGTNGVKISWAAVPGRTYQAQGRDSLDQTNWSKLGYVSADGSSASYTDPGISGTSRRLYRVVKP